MSDKKRVQGKTKMGWIDSTDGEGKNIGKEKNKNIKT